MWLRHSKDITDYQALTPFSSSLDGLLSALPSLAFDGSRQKVGCQESLVMPSFELNAMTSSIFFKQIFELLTFRRSSAVSRIERKQGRKSAI